MKCYQNTQKEKYKNMDMEQKLQKVKESKTILKYQHQQAMFTKAKTQSKAAVKASFIVAEEVAKSSHPFTKGEFVKYYILRICDVMCPEKRQLFSNVSLSRNTIFESIH